MTVGELGERMSNAEYLEWIAFLSFEAKYAAQQRANTKGK